MQEEYIDTYEAAEKLGISRPTLYRLIEQFGIKKYKVPGNRRTLIKTADLVQLSQPQEREGKAAA